MLTIFARGPPLFMVSKEYRWSPLHGASIALKIAKNELEVRKLWPPKVEILVRAAHSLLSTPSKNLKYYSVALKGRRWFVELKMAISKQFKLLNLNKYRRKLCINELGGVITNEKNSFRKLKKCIFFTAFLGCSFSYAFQRWFVYLEKALR